MFQGDFEDCFLNQKLAERVASLAFLQPTHLDVNLAPLSPTSPTAADGPMQPSVACVQEAVGCLRGLPAAACPSDKVRGTSKYMIWADQPESPIDASSHPSLSFGLGAWYVIWAKR